jgi:copper oxidase (laccase) domain-containing protein
VEAARQRLRWAVADRSIGDVHPGRVPLAELARRQRATSGDRWVMIDEVHGTEIVDVDAIVGRAGATSLPALVATGDVLSTRVPGRQLGVWVGDCAAIAVLGDGGTVVALHAGWAGLAAGIVDVALCQLARRGERPVEAVRGPVIGPCCYEFGVADLERVATGAQVAVERIIGETNDGGVALDVGAAVRAALERHGVRPTEVPGCTGCAGERWYSHRARGDLGRHALVAWSEAR